MLLLAAFLFAACGEENNSIIKEDDEKNEEVNGNEEVNDNEEVLQPGEVMVKGSVSGETSLAESDLSVQTFWGEAPLADGSFEVKAYDGDFPQLVYLTNGNDDVIMMRRGPVDVESMEVNEESTALALATMHPVFARITNDDLEEISGMIQGLSAYPAYLQAVKNNISAGKDIWNTENAELMTDLGNLLDEFCTEFLLAKSRATEITGINKEHFDVQTEGNEVIIRNKGLAPSYEISVYYGGRQLDLGTDNLVKSHADYDGWDVFLGNIGAWGDPFTITLSDEGQYLFYLDRTTQKAQDDLARRLWYDAVSIIGALIDVTVDGAGEFVTKASWDVLSLLMNPDTELSDWASTFAGWQKDYTKPETSSVKWKKAGLILGKIEAVCGAVGGLANEMARIKVGFDTEPFIEFSLCQYDNKVTSCTETELTIVSGDKQNGSTRRVLASPLVVSAKIFDDEGNETPANDNQKVKFEVVSGDGSVATTYADIDTDSNASVDWTLGRVGEQQVKAVIVDRTTDEEISQPVYFTATAKEVVYKVSLDWTMGDFYYLRLSVLYNPVLTGWSEHNQNHLECGFLEEFDKYYDIQVSTLSGEIGEFYVTIDVNGKTWQRWRGFFKGDESLEVDGTYQRAYIKIINPYVAVDNLGVELIYEDSSVFY